MNPIGMKPIGMKPKRKKVLQYILSILLILSLVSSSGTYAEVKNIYLDQDNPIATIYANCGGGNLKIKVTGGNKQTSQIIIDVLQKNMFDKSTFDRTMPIVGSICTFSGSSNVNTYNSSRDGLWASDGTVRKVAELPKFENGEEYTFSASRTGTKVTIFHTDGTRTYNESDPISSIPGKTIQYIGLSGKTIDLDTIQIEKGNKATIYEEFNGKTLDSGESLLDGDSITLFEDGTLEIERNSKCIVMNGSYNWIFNGDEQGYKSVKAMVATNVFDERTGVLNNYIGELLVNRSGLPFTGEGQHNGLQSNGQIILSIADTDSGWGESYEPSNDEISAFLNGWIMSNVSSGLYNNGDGTKRWHKRWSGVGTMTVFPTGAEVESGTAYINTCPQEKAYGEDTKHYELRYTLAKPEVYEKYLMALSLGKGVNHITLHNESNFTASVEYNDSIEGVVEQLARQSNEQTAMMKKILNLIQDSDKNNIISFKYDENGNVEVIKAE